MPAAANRGTSSGWTIWTCSMRGMSGASAAPGAQDAEHLADRRVADGVDLRRDARQRSPARPVRGGRRDRSSTRRDAGPRRSAGRARSRCPRGAPRSATRATRPRSTSASRRGPCHRDPRRAVGRSGTPVRWLRRPRRRACRHGHGSGAAPRRTGGRRPGRSRSGRVRGDAARVVAGDDAEREQLAAESFDRIGEGIRGRRRDVDRHGPGGGLVQDALGRAIGRAPDHPTGRVARAEVAEARVPRDSPTGRDGRAPRWRSAGPAPRTRGRRRSASHPNGRCPSRGPRARRRHRAGRGARREPSPGRRQGSRPR